MAGRSAEIKNKRAYHDYEILERFEAGIVLKGTEVKSVKEGRVSLKDSYVRLKDGEAFLLNAYIAPYPHAGPFNHEPERERKLLLHKREIQRLAGKIKEKGLTLIPLRMYVNKRGLVKVEIALARGKKKHEKREDIRKREAELEARRALKFGRLY